MRLHPILQTSKEGAAISREEQGRVCATKGTNPRDVGYGNRRRIFLVSQVTPLDKPGKAGFVALTQLESKQRIGIDVLA